MYKSCIIFITILGFAFSVQAQDVNIRVTINTDQIQTSDRSVYDLMQESLNQMIISKKWTDASFQPNELITGSILITLKQASEDTFKGEIQVSTNRPVFNSSYNTPLFNFRDTEFEFTYLRGESLEFIENNISNNLVATVAYYVYVILGFDFDSFGLNEGKPYFEKALNIATSSQSLNTPGWEPFGSDRNRYALALALTEESSSAFHTLLYNYHRKGLDEMADNTIRGRVGVVSSVADLASVYQARPASVLLTIFADAKLTEFLEVYDQATREEKDEAYKTLERIYPTRKYLLERLKK